MMVLRTKLIILTIAVAALVTQAFVSTDFRDTIAQSPNRVPLLAEIVNSDDDPIPVALQGTGAVSGEVSAIQSGDWDVNSAQSGDWDVNASQSGNWAVGIDPNQNVVQLDGNEFANRELFQGAITLSFRSSFEASRTFTVPEGKLLVVEQISAHGITNHNVDMILIRTPPITTFSPFESTDTIMTYRLPLHRGDRSFYVGSEQTRIYLRGGNDVLVHATRDSDSTSGQNQIFVTFTGYMVDMP